MNTVEWDGIQHKEKTKRGDDIMRLSKNGNIRIVFRRGAIQGKYAIQHLTTTGYWDSFSTAMYSSDHLGEVEKQCKYMIDEPLEVFK